MRTRVPTAAISFADLGDEAGLTLRVRRDEDICAVGGAKVACRALGRPAAARRGTERLDVVQELRGRRNRSANLSLPCNTPSEQQGGLCYLAALDERHLVGHHAEAVCGVAHRVSAPRLPAVATACIC